MEISLGTWEGKAWERLKKDEASLMESYMVNRWDAIPNADSSETSYNRSIKIWKLLRDAALERNAEKMIDVLHGGIMHWVIKSTFQYRSWYPVFAIGNCNLFTLRVEP